MDEYASIFGLLDLAFHVLVAGCFDVNARSARIVFMKVTIEEATTWLGDTRRTSLADCRVTCVLVVRVMPIDAQHKTARRT